MSLHVPSFAGGVVRTGSPDAQRTDELLVADSYDIGLRGQLVAASDVTDYMALQDMVAGSRLPWTAVYGMDSINFGGVAYEVVVGNGRDAGSVASPLIAYFLRNASASPIPIGQVYDATIGFSFGAAGDLVTVVQFPGVFSGKQVALVNLGSREGVFAKSGLGVYVLQYDVATAVITLLRIFDFSSLAEPGAPGLKQLHFRGIVGYNDFVFGWGYDAADTTNLDGPSRVMFSNIGNPLKWGNDNTGTSATRAYTDSDAIILGDAGEIVRAGLKWDKRLWFGTNRELHYIAGYGRNSFTTDGANAVAKSQNVIGPHAMIEGPDKLMYGVSDQGLWAFDGSTFEPHWRRLVSFDKHSPGWWDLIWTDASRLFAYPSRTNQDLVWMAVDWDAEQVIVGIPYCDATAGAGYGLDTVLIKFHVRSGGFTRQVLLGVQYTAGGYHRREAQEREVRLLGTGTAGQMAIKRYGYQATPTTSPILPVALPKATLGPYTPFGPDGDGVVRRAYLTLAWESSASLPIVFAVSTRVDASGNDAFALTVQPTAPVGPATGDLWLDTSESDTSIGNATAGANVKATGGFLLKTWSGAKWRIIPGSGEAGTRARIPMPLTRRKGARVTMAAVCTTAAGRFQIEGFGINPGGGSPDA